MVGFVIALILVCIAGVIGGIKKSKNIFVSYFCFFVYFLYTLQEYNMFTTYYSLNFVLNKSL
jgi:hypothetical protein